VTREALRELGVGYRGTFYGTFADQWRTKRFRDHENLMFLLLGVCTSTGREVADHVWMWWREATLAPLALRRGDVVSFMATVAKYEKRARDEYDERGGWHAVEDYKLSYPKGFAKAEDRSAPLRSAEQLSLEEFQT